MAVSLLVMVEHIIKSSSNNMFLDEYKRLCYALFRKAGLKMEPKDIIDGIHKYHDMEEVINDAVPRWNWGTVEQMSDWLRGKLKTLEYWKK
jgi:hypothetical protein